MCKDSGEGIQKDSSPLLMHLFSYHSKENKYNLRDMF